jgi:homogentisate 1,2-dioxygenase
MPGFGNHFSSEALPDALPKGLNNPQKCPYNLYNECISGTAFTAPRDHNQRSWLYRIRPSVSHRPFKKCDRGSIRGSFADAIPNPNQVGNYSALQCVTN